MSRHVKRGMPVDSLERAEKWRRRHLEPGRVKGVRYEPKRTAKPTPLKPASPARAEACVTVADVENMADLTAPEPAWFEIASASLELAAVVLRSGQNIEAMVPTLRAALVCVPVHERGALPLPLDVMAVLVADVLALLPPKEGNPLNDDGSPVWYQGDMPDDEAAEMEIFWYQVAAGEVRVA